MPLVRNSFLIQNHIERRDGYVTYPPPFFESPSPYVGTPLKETAPSPPSPPASPPPPPSGTRISPAVLFIIVILAVLFFISGLLHLLVRFLIKNPSSSSSYRTNRFPEMSTTDALQRQLQQLFHLHDSGLDQAFIDALPVFQYKDVVGQKEPFDCAVCLCEFSEKDKLRLLPMCSHAFHINCIDTWLLSNSTCPLCRGTLFTPGLPIENPMFDFDDMREEDGYHGNRESGLTPNNKSAGIEEIVIEKGVLPVRLGKFRRVNGAVGEEVGGETSSSNLDARRCYSMGSYQYVLGETELRVPLSHDQRGHGGKVSKPTEGNGDSSFQSDVEGKNINSVAKGESYSVSKIWLWPRKGKFAGTSNEHHGMPPSLQSDLPWMGRSD